MGRRPDPPGVQKAKAYPGKRETTVKARLAEARRVAKLLADAPADGAEKLAPPKFLDDRFPAALQVWRQLAPKLRETHRLPSQHRLTFALFCVYFAEWVTANEDIAKHGYTHSVPTISGGMMERMRPAVKIREIALANVVSLSKNFGLTPTDEYSLFKDQRLAAANSPGLFDNDGSTAPEPAPTESASDEPPRSAIGGLAALDGAPPPGVRPN